MNFIEQIHAHALKKPNAPALACSDRTLNYAELYDEIAKISATIGGNSPWIGVLTGQDSYTYASLPACWHAGKAYLPLFHQHPTQRLIEIIQDAGIQLVLASKEHQALINAAEYCQIPIIRTDTLHHAPRKEPREKPELAYMLYTSGSTGKPKGVPISMSALQAFFTAVTHKYDFQPYQRFLQMFELTFDLSVFSTFVPWLQGATVCPIPEIGITWMNILEILEEKKIEVALMVPSILHYFRPYFDEIQLPDLKIALFCGEALSHDLCKEWKSCVPQAAIENVYGPTEATIFCMEYTWQESTSENESFQGIVPIGRPLPGMEVFILDENNQEKNIGELILAGPQLAHHYYNRPEKTAEAFFIYQGKPAYKTGDLVQKNAQNVIQYVGRKDFQVKIDGHRVELGEIEQRVREILGPIAVVVWAKSTESGSSVLHLAVQIETLDESMLYTSLAQTLPAYMLPKKIHCLIDFPHNSSGKIDRKALVNLIQ